MRIPLDRGSDTPLYRQIEQFLGSGIASGALPPATRLPSARHLAHILGVSRITVETAYGALETAALVERRAGSGTYVLPPATLTARRSDTPHWPLWQHEALQAAPFTDLDASVWPVSAQRSASMISFFGFGDPRLFPVDEFYRAIKQVLRRDGFNALGWDDRRGYEPLRATIAQVLANQGLHVHADNVLITSGSQQALALVAQLLLKPGDTVLVESPTYSLALDLFRSQRLRVVGCPTDENGMQVEQLEPLLQQHHPRMIYTMPTFQSPTGTCLSAPRRRRLIALADAYNIPLLEDDFAAELRYEGRELPALKALDPGGRVMYVGTFSKSLMPGLRIGYLIADGPVYGLLGQLKRISDILSSTLTQRALESFVTVGRYQAHVRRLCRAYRRRRDVMLEAIGRYLPEATEVVVPQGGLNLWLRLPPGISSVRLLPYAAAEGVRYIPGDRHFPQPGDGASYLSLNFAMQPPEQIDLGMRRLGRALSRLTASTSPAHEASPAAVPRW